MARVGWSLLTYIQDAGRSRPGGSTSTSVTTGKKRRCIGWYTVGNQFCPVCGGLERGEGEHYIKMAIFLASVTRRQRWLLISTRLHVCMVVMA